SLINENYLENEYLKVEINENGSFNIEDKINNEVYTDLGIYENTGDIGNEYIYMQPVNDIGITTKDLKAKIEVKEDLPYKAVIEITHNWSIPKGANELLDTEIKEVLEFNKRKSQRSKDYIDFIIKTELILEKSSKGLKVKTTFNNVAKNHRLRALYPTDTNTSNHYSDSVFEVVKRNNEVSNEWENPSNCQHQHAFVNIKADDRGLTIANKGLNEYEVLRYDRNTVAITILRSVGELGDWGVFYTPEAQCLGEHSVELEILPCNKDSYESYKDAHLFQIPIIAKQINLQNGELEIKANLMELNGYGIMWSTLKLDYKNNYIVRVYNIYDNDAKLEFKDCSIEGKQYISNILEEKTENYIDTTVKLNKFEIKTIGIEKKCN
ncbi:MAG: glycoside hydrolase family 38 C-terminal domain-containing protein, partial [Peptostreptococcaceae bacterium]